jgi:sortase A
MSRDKLHIGTSSTSRHTLGHRLLRCIEYVCWSVGAAAIVWFAWASWSSAKFQSRQAERLESLQQARVEKTLAREGDPFGEISIPRLGLSAIVAEGVDETTLQRAVGHFPESSTPEGVGTVALAGHRDTFFRPLANIRLHDLVQLKTPRGEYEYEVVHTAIVGPEHVEVVQSSPRSDLTLVTCYPFRYVGQAPLRFIVQAVRAH